MSKMPTSPISRRTLCGLAGSALFLSQFPRAAFAAGGPSGLKVDFPQQGELGEVIGNPYDIAPLTAVIKNGGVVLTKAHVRVVPKKGGVEIAYDVGPTTLRTYGGIPVFGLYPEYLNTVEVTWTKRDPFIWILRGQRGAQSRRLKRKSLSLHQRNSLIASTCATT